MKAGPESSKTRRLIVLLEKTSKVNNAPIWKKIAEFLKAPRNNRPAVNISKLNKFSKAGDVIIVPGKMLGSGALDHAITIAAADMSQATRSQLLLNRCKVIGIEELIKENPNGSGVKIIV